MKAFISKARPVVTDFLALAIVPVLFTIIGALLQQRLEHDFQQASQRATRLEKSIEKEDQLLADFITTSSELLAVRSEVLLLKADADVRSHIAAACELRRVLGISAKPTRPTLESIACRDRDWNDDLRKLNDLNLQLLEKTQEKNAHLQSVAAEIKVFFGTAVTRNMQAIVQLTNTHPMLDSPTLAAFQDHLSVEQAPGAPVTENDMDELLRKIQIDIGNDPLKPLTSDVIADMARDLQLKISALPK